MKGARRRGFGLARMFCFSAGSARVLGDAGSSSRGGRARGRSSKHRTAEAAAAVPPPSAASAGALHPPPSPTGADALAAYLGRATAPAAEMSLASSAEDSIAQSSSYGTSGGSGGSGGSASSPRQDPGYEGDSDSDFAPQSEGSEAAFSARRFRPAVRHPRPELGAAAAAGGAAALDGDVAVAEAAAGAVQEIVEQFERLSLSSGSASGGHTPATAASVAAHSESGTPAVHFAPPFSTCTAELHAQPAAGSGTAVAAGPLGPSRSSSRGSSISYAASGSVSLAHFLVRSGSSHSLASGSLSGRRTIRAVKRLGAVTQIVLPDSPTTHPSPSAAAACATGGPAAAAPPAATAAAGEQAHEPAGPPGSVQRRLSELHSYHFVSLERIRSQAGDFQEPPPSLLSLMARRVFASRSASLRQALCSEGLLSDLHAADDSHLPTPSSPGGSKHTRQPSGAGSHSALGLPPPPPPPPSSAASATPGAVGETDAPEGALVLMPHLPPIRTRVGQARLGDSCGSSGAGSTAGGAASLNTSRSGGSGSASGADLQQQQQKQQLQQ